MGDEVLIAFGHLATSHLRPTDLFGRIGGEEFAALLPDTTPHDAIGLAERIRAAVEAALHSVGEHAIRTTVSVGVASFKDAATDLGVLLKEADQALYRAKEAGRNCVKAFSCAAERGPLRRANNPSIQNRSAA
jgi:diguanylate cyclase (GGDEF)-like protein